MNLRLLSTGAAIYGVLTVLSWIRYWIYIPATTAIVPTLALAVLGIATTAMGMVVKGRPGSMVTLILLISSFFLGVFGFISWFDASNENYHTADVCQVSAIYNDGYEWACPQVQATNQITWILAVSLSIPAVLLLATLYLLLSSNLHERLRT